MYRLLILLVLIMNPLVVYAHSSSESYLGMSVDGQQLSGYWQITVSDLEMAIGVDDNQDGNVTWAEITNSKKRLMEYVQSSLHISQPGTSCMMGVNDLLLIKKSAGVFLHFPLMVNCNETVKDLQIAFALLFDKDAQHHIIWQMTDRDNQYSGIAGAQTREHNIQLGQTTWVAGFIDFVRQGIWHISIGLDHILFVLLLMFSIEKSLSSTDKNKLRTRFTLVFKTITAFTLAHSITLALAVMGWVTADSIWVEAFIALSVVLAGLNFIFGWINERLWPFAFGFGLIHGFGFAAVMLDLDPGQGQLAINLLAFNLGVELGQLFIVLLTVPLLIMLMQYRLFALRFMQAGVWGVVFLASFWCVERLSLF